MMKPFTNLAAIQAELKSGKLTISGLVKYYLSNIENTKNLNAYIEVYEEEAIEKAAELDKKFKTAPSSVGKLFGMVLSVKDLIAYKNHNVTGASKILSGYVSPFSATALKRILAEDAIIIGRTNCDEFGMGSTNENSFYGITKNGINTEKIAGGSSGGSAVAVQSDTCLASLGTDTGGSVRQPAGFNGVIGFKPTYGRISRYGLLAYASSFDQIGIIAKSVYDTALLLQIMAGKDENDSTVSFKEVEEYSKNINFHGQAKIAYFKPALEHKNLEKDVRKATFDFIKKLENKNHIVEAIDFELLDFIIPAYYVLTTAEASTNLARYDGIRYGHRSNNAKNFQETFKLSRTEGFGKEVKRRIMLGTFVLSAGYYDAYYGKAQKVRRLISEQIEAIFKNYDFILVPVAPSTAWNAGEKIDDPVSTYLADIYTVLANLAGIPAISIPVGKGKDNMPIGIQLMANKFCESKLLKFSKEFYR